MIGDEVRNLFNNQFEGSSLATNLGGILLGQVTDKIDDELLCDLHHSASYVAFDSKTNKFGCHECIYQG
jgi:hypothetical protein